MTEYEGLTAVGYYRVSTDDKGQTTASQEREVKKYCEEKGIKYVTGFKEDISGSDKERPELQRLLGYLTLNRIGYVVAREVTRLSRDPDNEDYPIIRAAIHNTGAKILFVHSDLDPETEEGGLIADIQARIGGMEITKLRRNTKIGMATRAAQGKHCGRPLACVLEHNVERDRAKIKMDGKQQTKIIPMSVILDAVNEGSSTAALSKSIDIPRRSLEDMLQAEGILTSYKVLSNVARESRRKGLSAKRVDSLYISDGKIQFSEDGAKGSLSAGDKTLSAKEGKEKDGEKK